MKTEARKEYEREWRRRNRARTLSYHRRVDLTIYTQRAAWLDSVKSKPCADCGIQYPPYSMQFDHRDPSTKCFTIGAQKRRRIVVLEAEIAKCDVVCANCHFARGHFRRVAR